MDYVYDMRKFMSELEETGELERVNKEIESGHEVFSILWELYEQNGPAVVFEHIKGYDVPIVSNISGTLNRWAQSCGLPRGLTRHQYRDLFIDLLDHSKWSEPKIMDDL